MKNFVYTLALLAFVLPKVEAQNIATARAQALGSTVTVSGIVTNGDELGPIRYLEDASAGIAAYEPSMMAGVLRGDSITVTGVLVDYNGLLEIQPVNSFNVHGAGYSVTPQVITPNQLDEPTEAELVRIDNVTFANGGSTFATGTYSFTSGGQSGIIYVRNGSPLVGHLVPLATVSVIGISSQYTFTGTGGYQLLPRDMNDFIFPSGIQMTSALEQSNVTTTSFDLSWVTDTTGTTEIFYGLTPSLELGSLSQGGSANSHLFNLSGLNPGSIYYVQGFSVNGSDTAFSNIGVFATVSLSSGEVLAYFNKSVDTTVATISSAQNLGVYINDTIKAYMDRAQHSIDVAVYNHSDALLATALNDAHNRGVKVRYLTCASTASTAVSSLDPAIPVFERPLGMGLMHNKFVVIDADDVNGAWVMTGSTNWTTGQLFDDPNNLLLVQDQSIARTFELEFEEMWGDTGMVYDATKAKFGADKADNTPHDFIVNGQPMEVYFSPSDQTTSHIEQLIASADDAVQFALLAFTKDELGWALEGAHNNGVAVEGIIEQVNTTGSEYQYLVDAGIDVRSHSGVSGIFHHKYVIVDQDQPFSDPAVLTGSHNWSAAAENSNDENSIIVYDAEIANHYYQEFIERYNELGNVGIEQEQEQERGRLLYITDLLGKKVFPQKNEVQLYIYENGVVEKRLMMQQ